MACGLSNLREAKKLGYVSSRVLEGVSFPLTFIHFIFDPVARQIEEDLPDIKRISVYVEPSYDDYSRVVMVTENKVLYQDCIKAWHLVFSSIFEMKTYLEEVYKKILEKINNQSRKEKSKKGR